MLICLNLHCLLLAFLCLNTEMHKQTLMSGSAAKLGIVSLACSLTDTASQEHCVSSLQGFQLRKDNMSDQPVILSLYLCRTTLLNE